MIYFPKYLKQAQIFLKILYAFIGSKITIPLKFPYISLFEARFLFLLTIS